MRHPNHVLQLFAAAAALVLAACGTAPASSATSDSSATGGDTAAGDAATGDATGGDTAAGDSMDADASADTGDGSSGSGDGSAETAGGDTADAAAPADAQPGDAQPADTEPGDATAEVASASVTGKVVEAGWSFGECLHACKGKMALQGASLQLTISDNDGTPAHMAKGVLTTGAAAALDDLTTSLVGKPLALVTGCPDCADGGAAYVVFSDGVTSSKHSYPFGKPPAALAPIDKLLSAAMAGLTVCKGDETVVVLGSCPLDQP